MKGKVIKAFVDKDTLIGYNEGAIYESDKERISELQELGYLAVIKKEKKVPPEIPPDETPPTE